LQKHRDLSSQQIQDCSGDGSPLSYAAESGLMAASAYNNAAPGGVCAFDSATVAVSVAFVGRTRNGTEAELNAAVELAPVIATIVADDSFNRYEGGVIGACVDGASATFSWTVLVVGFDDEAWTVKNEYSSTWGEEGYARLQRGVNACNISVGWEVPEGVVSLM